MKKLRNFTVGYTHDEHAEQPEFFTFTCKAEDKEHAREQCVNAYPGCFVLYVARTDFTIK